MRKEKRELLDEYFAEARRRELQGLSTYGPFEPKTDKRILSQEAQDEIVDVLNYMRFFQRKYPDSYNRTLGVRRLAFSLYCALRDLEAMELQLIEEKGGTP